MSLLVRKIAKAKWMQNDILNGADVSADAITGCLRTTSNALSVWQISREDEIEDAVLAIISAHEKPDKIDVVLLDKSILTSKGFIIRSTPSSAITAFTDFENKHFDICELTYSSLGTLAEQIVCAIKKDKIKGYTRGNTKDLIQRGITMNKIQKNDLREKLRQELGL